MHHYKTTVSSVYQLQGCTALHEYVCVCVRALCLCVVCVLYSEVPSFRREVHLAGITSNHVAAKRLLAI